MKKVLDIVLGILLFSIVSVSVFISFLIIEAPKETPVLITGYVQGLGD